MRYLLTMIVAMGAFGGNAVAAPTAKPPAFAMCAACHKVEKDAPKSLGPNLWGVGGRVSGTQTGFNYSPALKKAAIKWDRASLVSFITDPRSRVPGNRMAYVGQKDPAKAQAIADYLLSLK